jgi:MFS family permease
VPYLERAQWITDPDQRALLIIVTTGIVALCTAISTIPAARIADRYGRKRVIYAACFIAGFGMTICALAPSVPVFIGGAILMGVGTGSFLAVDWALMTDIIPKASAGRYMGISNVATATNGVVSGFIGGLLIDALVRAGSPAAGPRVAFLLAPVWLAIGALLLRPVVERRREDDSPIDVGQMEPGVA